MPENYFDFLPDEIMMVLFSFLKKDPNAFAAFAQSCKRMNNLSLDHLFWKKLFLSTISSHSQLDSEYRTKYIETYSFLRKFLPTLKPFHEAHLPKKFNCEYPELITSKDVDNNDLSSMKEKHLEQNSALHDAVLIGNLQLVEILLAGGVAVDPLNDYGLSPLHWACMHAHTQIVKQLLDYKADPNRLSLDFNYPLLLALTAETADAQATQEIVTLLLMEGANPDGVSANLQTPLAYAVAANKEPVISLLLLAGASPVRINDNALLDRANRFIQAVSWCDQARFFGINHFFSKYNLSQILKKQPDLACFFYGWCLKRREPDLAKSILDFVPEEFQSFAQHCMEKTILEVHASKLCVPMSVSV